MSSSSICHNQTFPIWNFKEEKKRKKEDQSLMFVFKKANKSAAGSYTSGAQL